MKVKIYGAGSIGNHLANASRQLGWSVDICDIDQSALLRTKELIYPGRYDKWDESIGLYSNSEVPRGSYDLIFIGTPPDTHLRLGLDAIGENPRAILIEKPFCSPDLDLADEFLAAASARGIHVFVGYDHVVGKAARIFESVVMSPKLGKLKTLDVEFREHWGGIFAAHPWLSGPEDSYLGFSSRGGGAAAEHSHALNLWQHFAHVMGAGRIMEVQAVMNKVTTAKVDYDELVVMNLITERGLVGRCVQDVITMPHKKYAKAQFVNGSVEAHFGRKPGEDVVVAFTEGTSEEHLVSKTRPDDFIEELKHISAILDQDAINNSPISINRGLDTMLVVAACALSNELKRNIIIDYSRGYNNSSLIPA